MLRETPLYLRLNPADDVVIARQQLIGGTKLLEEDVTVAGLVPPGHKVATRAIAGTEPFAWRLTRDARGSARA